MKLLSLFGLSALALSLTLGGCKDDDTDNISRIKSYAAISLNGAALTSVNIGEAFTDPGATATFQGAPLTPIVVGRVDNTRPGFYTIRYRGANTEGDTVEAVRVIAVVDPAVNNINQSGAFTRDNGAPVNITRVSKGLYLTDNFGGVPPPNAAVLPAYFAQLTPTTFVVPTQLVAGAGTVTFTSPTFTLNAAGLITQFKYAIGNPGFNPAVRTFNRKP